MTEGHMTGRRGARPVSWKLKGLVAFGVAALVLLVAVRVVVHSWRIPQNGMYPSYPKGSLVWGRRLVGAPPDIRRGDVVVYEKTRDGNTYDFVWRVVGLPGETVEIRDDVVLINGQPMRQEKERTEGDFDILREHAEQTSYLVALPRARAGGASDHPKVVVPADSVFVLGDNRHNAFDSRGDGAVPLRAIHARAFR